MYELHDSSEVVGLTDNHVRIQQADGSYSDYDLETPDDDLYVETPISTGLNEYLRLSC